MWLSIASTFSAALIVSNEGGTINFGVAFLMAIIIFLFIGIASNNWRMLNEIEIDYDKRIITVNYFHSLLFYGSKTIKFERLRYKNRLLPRDLTLSFKDIEKLEIYDAQIFVGAIFENDNWFDWGKSERQGLIKKLDEIIEMEGCRKGNL